MTIFVNLNASGSNDGSSWNNAYKDLQSAIDAATSGEEIWVAKGTYTPVNSFEIKDKVKIYGGFAAREATLTERNIKNNLTTLSGNNQFTVIKFTDKTGTATIDGFTIQDGNSNDDGGGVYNDGTLTLQNVVVRNNQAIDDGGGIRNNGIITIIDSTIADNTAISNSSQTSGGGGLINTGESATIINSTFSGNTAKNGGAIRNDTVLNLINSTLSGNTAAFSGGGLVNTIAPKILIDSLAPLSPDDDLVGTGKVTITNSTITKNTASPGNASGLAVGSGIANFAVLNISNSIIADNTNNDDFAHIFTIERTIPGTDTVIPVTVTGKNNSGGNNLMGNGEGVSGFTDGNNGDQVGTKATPIDPSLNALADNGGATQTHALKEGSRAIDAGDNSKIAEDKADLDKDGKTTEAIPFEQRGEDFKRIVGDAVDIGAVEFVGASSSPSNIIINEILADPPSGNDGDANGDGTRDGGDDEFIELVNNSDSAIDISGWTLSDGSGVKHTFPSETIVPANGVILVFGGGTPTGNFGGAIVQTASTRSLSLNNSGDTVTLNNGTKDIASYTYGDEGGNNQSLTRNPDITGDFIQHSQATNSGGALFSPGTTLGNTTPPPSANPGIAIAQSENTTNVTEGGATDSYTAVLNSEPISDVTVTISSNGETTTDLATLTFTTDNWNTPQTVT
ncbi:MAG: lamin tail domain-containing protein, partial [Rivularia sp. (in: cyanobacteria)]